MLGLELGSLEDWALGLLEVLGLKLIEGWVLGN